MPIVLKLAIIITENILRVKILVHETLIFIICRNQYFFIIVGVLLPLEFTKIERAVELAIDMINENEIDDIRLNASKLSASFHIADLYNSYDNFHKGNRNSSIAFNI